MMRQRNGQHWLPPLHLYEAALLFFDQNEVFTEIEESAEFYRTVEDRAFHFVLPVDPPCLLDLSVSLGTLLLMDPILCSEIFQEVIFCTLTSLKILPQCTSLSQVVVNFKLISLPKLPGYQLNSARELNAYKTQHRFWGFSGIVTGKSILHKYTKNARYVCPTKGCEGHSGNKFIRLHTAGALETQMIRRDFTCMYCRSPLAEDLSCRVLADKYLIEVVDDIGFLSYTKERKMHQAVICHVRDCLIQEMEIGQSIELIGIPVQDLHHQTITLEDTTYLALSLKMTSVLESAYHCIQKTPVNNILSSNHISENTLRNDNLPPSIGQLYNDRKASPWSFALSLAYAFASDVSSVGTFVHLKLGLLLSLVGAESHDIGILDVLAVGSDTLLLKRLLCDAASYCSRSLVHSEGHHLTAAVAKERAGSGVPFIEGGSILLSGDGVCVIPELNNLKKQKMKSLLQVLESNSVFVDIPSSSSNPTKQQLFLPRRCRVWGTCESVMSTKLRTVSHEQLMNRIQQENVQPALADGFGQVYFCDVKPGSYAECLLQNSCFMSAIGMSSSSVISTDDFRQFIDFAKAQRVEFEAEAEDIIRNYYIVSRRLRSCGLESNVTLPVNAVKTITSMAKAHAKLSLRRCVTEFDAAAVVLLYEEQMTIRSGVSLLNVKPLIHFPDNNIHDHLGSKLDERMSCFYQTLKHFIAANTATDGITEE